MSEQPIEQPQIEEEPVEAVTEATVPIDEIMAELEGLGVKTPEQLQNMAVASSQVGHMANQLGEARNIVSDLQQQVKELTAVAPAVMENEDFIPDLKSIQRVVETGLADFYKKNVIAPQKEATDRYYKEIAEIEGDPDFQVENIKNLWNAYKEKPAVQSRLMRGETTLKKEYDKVAKTFWRSVATSRQESKPPVIPHMETGDTMNIPIGSEEQQQSIKDMVDPKRWQGTDDNIENLMKTLLPKDDPIFG